MFVVFSFQGRLRCVVLVVADVVHGVAYIESNAVALDDVDTVFAVVVVKVVVVVYCGFVSDVLVVVAVD